MADTLTFAVPIEWSKTTAYEQNIIVFVGKRAYTSLKAVPSGVEITDTSYWAETGVFNVTDKLKSYAKKYSSVNDMLSDNNLNADTLVYCERFYTDNSKGGGFYRITSEGEHNGFDVFTTDNGLFANRIADSYDPADYGAKCNGTDDDSDVCNFLLEKYNKIVTSYELTCAKTLVVNSNSYVSIYKMTSTADYAFDISGIYSTININKLNCVNGFLIANREYSQGNEFYLHYASAEHSLLVDGIYSFQSFYFFGETWHYGNSIADFTNNEGFIGNMNFQNMNFSMPGFGTEGSKYYNSTEYAFKLNCGKRQFTGFNFINVSFESAGNGINCYNMSSGRSIENLFIYSARTAEFSLIYHRKLLKLSGTSAPLTGYIFIDYAYDDIVDLTDFNTLSQQSFILEGKFFYTFRKNPTYEITCNFNKCCIGYKKLIVTSLNKTSPSISPNTLSKPTSLTSELIVIDNPSGEYFIKLNTSESALGVPVRIVNVRNSTTTTINFINENDKVIKTCTITNGDSEYHKSILIVPINYNYKFFQLIELR